MKRYKKDRKVFKGTNAIDPATSTCKNFGFNPIPGKGGATTNFEIPEWMFERELQEYKEGILDA